VKYRQITNIRYFEINFVFTILADNYAAKDSYFPKYIIGKYQEYIKKYFFSDEITD